MHIIAVLGLIMTLVFGLIAFGALVDIQADIGALTSGGIQSLSALFPTFWMFLLGAVSIAAVIAVAKMLG